jgi:predicted Zn-dependent protease
VLKGRPDEANLDFDRALEFGPDTAAVFLGRGLSLLATGQAARAVAALDQAIGNSCGGKNDQRCL